VSGNPGLSSGLSSYLEERLGDVIGFFVHDAVSDNGANVEFRIVGIRFGRLMEVDIRGDPDQKRVVVQPVTYSGPGVQTSPGAGSTGGLVFTMRLIG
jgi:glycosyltransferase involved in cell wall biosynthesis